MSCRLRPRGLRPPDRAAASGFSTMAGRGLSFWLKPTCQLMRPASSVTNAAASSTQTKPCVVNVGAHPHEDLQYERVDEHGRDHRQRGPERLAPGAVQGPDEAVDEAEKDRGHDRRPGRFQPEAFVEQRVEQVEPQEDGDAVREPAKPEPHSHLRRHSPARGGGVAPQYRRRARARTAASSLILIAGGLGPYENGFTQEAKDLVGHPALVGIGDAGLQSPVGKGDEVDCRGLRDGVATGARSGPSTSWLDIPGAKACPLRPDSQVHLGARDVSRRR